MPANSLRPMETRNNVIPHRHTETHEQNGHSIHYRKYNGNRDNYYRHQTENVMVRKGRVSNYFKGSSPVS